jgi:TPR repeat protein
MLLMMMVKLLDGLKIQLIVVMQLQARIVFHERVAKGHRIATSIFKVGEMYRDGIGVKQYYIKAMEYFRSSSLCVSNIYIGNMYENGEGVKQDYNKAMTYYRRSFHGSPRQSNYCMGRLFYYGHGMDIDIIKALGHFHMAQQFGHRYAASYICRIEDLMK